MKKTITRIAYVVMLSFASVFALSQYKMQPHIEVHYSVQGVSVPYLVQYYDSRNNAFYGAIQSVDVYRSDGTIGPTIIGLNNTFGYPDKNAGNVFMQNGARILCHAILPNGNEFVGIEDTNYIRQLNSGDTTYKPIVDLHVDAPVKQIFLWSTTNLFLTGFQKVNNQFCTGKIIWNSVNHAITHTTGPAGDSSGNLLEDNLYYLKNNDAVLESNYTTGEIYVIPKGDSVWKTTSYPHIPNHNRFLGFAGDDKNDLFFAIATYDFAYKIYESKNFGPLVNILTLTPPDSNTYINNNDPLLGFSFHKGKLYFQGDFTKVNGRNSSGFAVYDVASGLNKDVVQTLPYTRDRSGKLFWNKDTLIVTANYGKDPFGGTNTVYIVADTSALPVTLLSFTAINSGKTNILNWQTAQEINSDHFDIERSGDGNNFQKVGTVASAGNSNVTKTYLYIDENPSVGVTFYRLKIVDEDGSFTYSNIAKVNGPEITTSVYPNPAHTFVNITINSQQAQPADIMLVSSNGKILQTIHIALVPGNNSHNVQLNEIVPGIYFVNVLTKNGKIYQTKIVRE